MKRTLYFTASCLTVLFYGCRADEPAPLVTYKLPVIELQLTQAGNAPYTGEALCGRGTLINIAGVPAGSGQTPYLLPLSSEVVVKTFRPGTQRFNLGPMDVGQVVCLMLCYRGAGEPGSAVPQAGQYLEGEVFADGKSIGSMRLDRSSFGTPFPCNRFTDGRGTHIYNQDAFYFKPSKATYF